ncbi:MAG: APC family permease [Actinobacteria bacterium]|nr:APC family permease [Actinomycetota bacterium]
MFTLLKRLLVGRPLSTSEQEHQRLSKPIALATFSSDPISSTAYATEEILFVIAAGASSLALGLEKLVPMSMAVAFLLVIVVSSYRQTIHAYPKGGGSYVVSRENLPGRAPSLVAGASLMVDYILTVAVSISAGVAAIISLPAFNHLEDRRVLICLGFLAILTMGNLRGLKESGKIFAAPTYLYITILSALVGYGLFRSFFGDIEPVPFDRERAEGIAEVGGSLSLFILLRGFSSGAVALSGIEALADGVPAFRKPEAKNAATTLTIMACILGTLFFGVSVLAHHLHPYPTHEETVISQMGRAVFGEGPLHVILQFATAGILILAANTAYADFPRLSSIIARDGYLPRQFANRGDRLVFSNGVVFLAVFAGILLIVFGGITTALIPLYAVGVFTSFTLSQTGMVFRHRRLRKRGWKRNMVLNSVGATSTFVVLLIVSITKFTVGAWLPIVVVPTIIAIFLAIHRHYQSLEQVLAISPADVRPTAANNTVVVLVGRVHRGVVNAIQYARSLRPNHITALYVAYDDEERERMEQQWADFGFDVPLEVINSPYRELPPAVEAYLDELDERWNDDIITVIIPEFVAGKYSPTQLLHNQSALALKVALLFRRDTIVTSVPYHVGSEPLLGNGAPEKLRRSRSQGQERARD